ncbi:MAG: universal stress protein [Acidobacteriota bacterium]|nr:universal stress protein [Acidobacteriota bacterium]
MERFRNILFVAGLDHGPVPRRALERALSLARANRAKLTFFDVVHEPELSRAIVPPGILARVRGDRCRLLTRLAAEAQERGVETEAELAVGKPFLEIIRKVQRSEHDLVITTRGRSLGAGAIDRTTMQLMRRCPCATWVLRAHAANRFTRVLAAIDPDANNRQKDSLNRKIMELAVSMARREGSELHVVHVWKLYGLPVGASGEQWKQWEQTAGAEIKRRLYDFLTDCDLGLDSQVHFVAGKPAVAISRLASRMKVDLLVMGTVCRTGVRGLFIGNTAEGVLERVDCSLLTVKPDGFVSPIRLPGFQMSDRAPADREAR